ncbi:MAG: helix-turn-helix domain-containing protein [candidate division WOR-3 bacterium]|nr:helix-turn-helix domain-containing protein [candidate division WOR-3 bacterium]
MRKSTFVFTKEMAELLKKMRIKSGLSQAEVAVRIGFSYKSADSFIAHLEKGLLKNPPMDDSSLYMFLRCLVV